MLTRIFIDTSFLLALHNRRDQYHQQAVALSLRHENRQMLTTDAILLEIGNALARGRRLEATAIIQALIDADEVKIISLNQQLFAQAFNMYQQHQDKEWGLIDCVSFVVMLEAGLTEALTFDHHFTQAGFQALNDVDKA